MRSVLAALAIAIAPIAQAADQVSTVPSQFLGEWNSRLEHCGAGYSDSRLRIEAKHIHFYESDGPIKAAVVHGRYEIAMIVELSGEGQTWLTTAQFTLSQDGTTLTSTSIPGEPFIRYKCPARIRSN